MAQRIIIPKGTVNAGETSVIEIPSHYSASNVVIATPKPMNRSLRASSPIPGPSRQMNQSLNCVCPSTPGDHSTSYHSDQGFSRYSKHGTPPSPIQAATPRSLGNRHRSPQPSHQYPESFVFSDDASVYDDTMLVKQRREKIHSPHNYSEFHHEVDSNIRDRHHTPPPGKSCRKMGRPKLWEQKSLRHGMTEAEMYEIKCMMHNVRFCHELRVYQNARRNLLRRAAKVTHDVYKHITKQSSKSRPPGSPELTGFKTLE